MKTTREIIEILAPIVAHLNSVNPQIKIQSVQYWPDHEKPFYVYTGEVNICGDSFEDIAAQLSAMPDLKAERILALKSELAQLEETK